MYYTLLHYNTPMKDKIFNICETLKQSGINPTAEKVRNELGSGSFTTISPIIREWKDTQSKTETVPAIPPEAQNAVTQATALIWKIATDHQTEAINAVRQECNCIEQEALAERDEALKEIQFLESQLQTLKTNLETVEKQNLTITTEKASLELQIQKQQLIIDSTTIFNEDLKNEVKELRKVATTAQSEASKLEGMLEVYKSQSQTKTQFQTENQNRTQNEPVPQSQPEAEPKTQPPAKGTITRKTVPKDKTGT